MSEKEETKELPSCLRCRLPMEAGFLIERGRNGVYQSEWMAGKPEQMHDRFLGFDMAQRGEVNFDHEKALKVVTYRCQTCGYLESYAR